MVYNRKDSELYQIAVNYDKELEVRLKHYEERKEGEPTDIPVLLFPKDDDDTCGYVELIIDLIYI
jgi:hypothetical protein